VDGPVGVAGAGFLLSLRSGFTGLLASKNEATYVRGETGDWLAKAEAPAFGGQLRVLGYDSENEVDAAAAAEREVDPAPYAARNTFEWHSRSFGAAWTGSFRGRTLRLQGWRAASDASAFWTRAPVALILGAKRRDEGALAALEHSDARATTVAGVRFERSRTSYDVGGYPALIPWSASVRLPIVSGFLQHARPIHSRLDLEVGASLAAAAGSVYPGPRARLRWKPWGESTLSLSYARLHQFAQSLRNPESVAGNIFPADLYLGAGAAAVPVGRSDQGVIAAEVRPWPGIRLGLQAYGRALDGLVLVAPRQGEPFATGGFAAGSGASRGLAIDLAASGTRYGVVASYGWQRVRLAYGDSSYVPDHGSTHVLEAGATVFPTATSSIRLGIAGALGRRTTAVAGAFEWESCNLLDQGCEFAGAPHASASPGTATLPHYLRVDLGVRKHWDVEIGGRNAWVALFGTVTNVFARRNVLTYAEDPASGERVLIEMRPRAPLVVGLDWQF
ncbi:MAG: hypothetical protein HY561_13975, partial [Gemmatimonadetes bacterium]|nr:hypothetical protein [Gemmatimonadota bacterium]